jgi:endonuclease YncB( thermonuclease family)
LNDHNNRTLPEQPIATTIEGSGDSTIISIEPKKSESDSRPGNTSLSFKSPHAPIQAIVKRVVDGDTLQLATGEFDQQRVDRYGRLLGYVFLESGGILVNEKIIADGYGHAYTKYPFRDDYMERFRKAERDAREKGKGLWNNNRTASPEIKQPTPGKPSGSRGEPSYSSTLKSPAPRASNQSSYGQVSPQTGQPKTSWVEGYYRKDGTYVRGHYRSAPRR